MTQRILLFLILGLTLTATGCGGAASLSSWQRSVERYIDVNGAGDPTVLRDVKLPDGRAGFSVLGAPNPRESTDANAVLLGHAAVSGQPRFVYLVGIVDRQAVKDIRLAALSIVNGKCDWKMGKKDSEAFKTYQLYQERRWRERFPDRKAAPPEYTIFPQSSDHFDLKITDQAIIGTHRESGARWELPIETKAP